ncbi:unnamed protein product [Parnassius mnemosyne]|uniref:CCHC-type domain-containing protein n=1 Tax=Parnassius mnemosyne TaxID=213953 RepID=A0AAV1LIY0_9NEOP
MGESTEQVNMMKTKEPQTATDNSTSLDIEAELGLLGLCKPVHRTDDEWSDVESIVSGDSRRSSILPPAYKRAGISMDLATQRANDFLLAGKEALEKAGNMKRECKQEVHDCLQGLYETVLSLSDSRSRHRLALEQERSRAAKELVRVERAHTKQLTELQSTYTQRLKVIQDIMHETQKSTEAIRGWLNYEMDDPIKAIYKIKQVIYEISTKTSKEPPTCIADEHLKQGQTHNSEELASIANQVNDIMEKIKELDSDINVFKNNVADKESIEHIALALNSWKDPRIDDIASNISNVKHTIQDMQTRALNVTSPQSTSIDSISTAIEPVLFRIDKITEDIKELRDYGVSQSAFQNNSGLGTELAIAEIRDKLNHLETCNCSNITNKTTESPKNVVIKEQQAARQIKSYPEALTSPRFALVVESSDPRHTSEDVVNTIKNNIDVVQLGVGVNNIRRIRNQKVLLSCDNDEDREKLQNAIRNSDKKLTVSKSTAKNPLLKLIGVANDLNNTKLEEALVNQNIKLLKHIEMENIKTKVLRRIKGRTAAINNIILEVSPEVWKALKDQRVHVGYQIVPALDQSPVVQCYRCMGFGHRARECRADK